MVRPWRSGRPAAALPGLALSFLAQDRARPRESEMTRRRGRLLFMVDSLLRLGPVDRGEY
jgi:hypothetical protein